MLAQPATPSWSVYAGPREHSLSCSFQSEILQALFAAADHGCVDTLLVAAYAAVAALWLQSQVQHMGTPVHQKTVCAVGPCMGETGEV